MASLTVAKGKDVVDLKGFNYVNGDIEKAMMVFNEAYLGHVNAFTKLAYKDDPAVAAVLITNENDLTEHYGNALLPNQKVPKHNALFMSQARAFARTHRLAEDRVWRSWNDPARLAMLPAAALIFRQQHVRQAVTAYSWSPSAAQLFEAPLAPAWLGRLRLAAERGRLTTTLPRVVALGWLRATQAPAGSITVAEPGNHEAANRGREILSDTGELRRDWTTGVFSVDTSRSQAAGGRIGGREIALADVKLRLNNAFASVAVQTLDDKPIGKSNDSLVSVASSSFPSDNASLPYRSEPMIGDLEIQAMAGLRSKDQSGVQVRRETGRYIVHFDGKAPVHWVSLRGASKGE